jgi:L-threonylcarbamoyladenylate synthase
MRRLLTTLIKRRTYLNKLAMNSHLLIAPDKSGLEVAAEAIARGELIAFPTETVYGLGANALDEKAVLSIFEAKGRPLTDPLIVHVPDFSSALNLVSIDSETERVFRILATEFWPGPLTVILKAADCIPRIVTANSGFVGIRIPSHPLALAFLEACKLPVAAPSANRFGHVSPTRAQHVLDDLGCKGVRVIDGDSSDVNTRHTCLHGIESTVLKIDADSSRLVILRQGAVSQREIECQLAQAASGCDQWTVESLHRTVPMPASHPHHALGSPAPPVGASVGDAAAGEEEVGEVAPGQLITHYAPYVPCFVLASAQINLSAPGVTDSLSAGDIGSVPVAFPSGAAEQSAVQAGLVRYARTSKTLTSRDMANGAVIIDFAGQLQWLADKCLAYRDLSASGSCVAAAKEVFSALRWAEVQPGAAIVIIAPIVTPLALTDANEDEAYEVTSRNKKFDPSLGLADRIFRSASAVALELVILST